MSATLIDFDSVTLGYDGESVLAGVDLQVHEGDFLGIVGPNGAGKTTLLRGMLKLLDPLHGEVRHHRPLAIGYVPQRHSLDDLFPVSAHDVALMGRFHRLGVGRRPGERDRRAAHDALEATGVANLAASPFRNLSGGQRQRVLIARALVADPDVLVLDEPTSGMDLGAESAVMNLVHRLHRERSLTVILVSHQLTLVARWVQQLGLLQQGQFTVGPVDEILTGASLSRLYGDGVRVVQVEGHPVILPPPVEPT